MLRFSNKVLLVIIMHTPRGECEEREGTEANSPPPSGQIS